MILNGSYYRNVVVERISRANVFEAFLVLAKRAANFSRFSSSLRFDTKYFPYLLILRFRTEPRGKYVAIPLLGKPEQRF